MRGSPTNAAPEPQPIATTPRKQPKPEAAPPVRVSTSRYAKPKILMGEVAAPKGQIIGAQRDAFRAFMTAHHLRPTEWARAAGIPAGEILGFLTGKARNISEASLQKLAAAAKVAPEDLLK